MAKALLAARFLPRVSDVLTLAEVIQLAADEGMVLCVPKNFSPERDFTCTCFPPDRIPAGWRPASVMVKTPTIAVLETPCAA